MPSSPLTNSSVETAGLRGSNTVVGQMISDLALMEIQVSALFRLDARNRLLAVNEPGNPPPPRLFFGRTGASHLWRFHHDLSQPFVDELEALLLTEPVATDLSQPPRCLPTLQAVLARDHVLSEVRSGPAWRFPDVLPTFDDEVIPITSSDNDLVRSNFPILADDLLWRQPCLAVAQDGRLASLCFSSRNTFVAAEAGANTLEEFRGRGFAPVVVAAWARAVREEGRIPLYSTSWDNLASQSVAGKLGLVLYGADLSIE
jgi:hypothetical protein